MSAHIELQCHAQLHTRAIFAFSMDFWYRLWLYSLPFPMWFAEYFMRTIMHNPDVNNFFPSSLAAMSLGLVIPVLAPKPVRQTEVNPPSGILFVGKKDEAVRRAGMIFLFLAMPLWLATVFLSRGGEWPPGWVPGRIDQKFWIGVILYLTASGLSEWKEWDDGLS